MFQKSAVSLWSRVGNARASMTEVSGRCLGRSSEREMQGDGLVAMRRMSRSNGVGEQWSHTLKPGRQVETPLDQEGWLNDWSLASEPGG